MTLAAAALLLAAAALALSLFSFMANASARAASAERIARLGRDVDTLVRSIKEMDKAFVQEAKRRRALKSTLLAARDAHAGVLEEHAEKFERLPSQEGIAALVEQHNAMARDMLALKEEFSTIRSGASLRKVTGT